MKTTGFGGAISEDWRRRGEAVGKATRRERERGRRTERRVQEMRGEVKVGWMRTERVGREREKEGVGERRYQACGPKGCGGEQLASLVAGVHGMEDVRRGSTGPRSK